MRIITLITTIIYTILYSYYLDFNFANYDFANYNFLRILNCDFFANYEYLNMRILFPSFPNNILVKIGLDLYEFIFLRFVLFLPLPLHLNISYHTPC